ncbi:LysR family transcriptional regulator [Herbihabitans rhizosphaerae]|uniref:LysR family transcriptional regulator n=1 Tax=Herbihabitans rhizosphaerae TaxID=1872711 RepID=A0A4Q7L3M4_9PSEU|nr:LysR family transcriptional regulator [Herbihabitans rhizosphaerae]RZS44208.1 LysR family transcriptional regulator [Herbihabitans rhizosphaerae]
MDRLETRELHYFVAVAEELHFGRAARRIGIAQPPLSRAIRQLERRLGVRLLDRTSRKVELTPAGATLLHEGRKALEAVAAAGRRARRMGRDEPRLVVVTKPGGDGGMLPDILDAYAREPGALPVEPVLCGVGEQAALLRDGRADVGLLHRPYDDMSGFDTEDLRIERPVLIVPRQHRLAGRESVRMRDLEGEPMPRWPNMPDDGSDRPLVRDAAQLLGLITLGRVVAVLPESAQTDLNRELVAVPVSDGQSSTIVVAWPERSSSLAVAAFVRAAVAVAESTVDDHEPSVATISASVSVSSSRASRA